MRFKLGVVSALAVTSLGVVVALAPPSTVVASPVGGPVLALTAANVVIGFDAADPGTISSNTPIGGLVDGETVVAIDIRPATGQLYAVALDGSTGHVYTVDTSNGLATLVNDDPIAATLPTGGRWSMDFNPVVDRMRLVHSSGASYRLNPLNGSLVATDGTVGAAVSSALSYDRSTATAPDATTLFSIDGTTSTLNLIGGIDGDPSPNTGVTTEVGPLGVTVDGVNVGFDISPSGGALATLRVGGLYGLYTIDLSTGAATLVGLVGPGNKPVLDIATRRPPVGSVLALTESNTLVRFDAATPGSIASTIAITGLAPGVTIAGFDVRPATGEVIGLGMNGAVGRLYRLDPATGASTPIGAEPFATDLPAGGGWAVDVNPVVDRVRLVHSSGANFRVNPGTGALVSADFPVTDSAVTALAYDRSIASTTLYSIDGGTSTLNLIGGPDGTPSPNTASSTLRGPLDVTLDSDKVGFDITTGGEAIATLSVGGVTGLYTIDLAGGRAWPLGAVGAGDLEIIDIAFMPRLPTGASQFTAVAPARLLDTRNGATKPGTDTTIDVQVAGVGGVPPDATAVVLNVTGTEATADGFITVFPKGIGRPLASNNNLVEGGTKAALTTSKVGADGMVSIYVQNGAHIVVDVFGYYASPTGRAGRFAPLPPARLVDTRDGEHTKLGEGGSVSVQVTGRGGVPVGGVSAVIVNLTVTEATAPGFVQAYASGTAQPTTSNLNVERVGGTVSNLAIVPVGDDGKIVVFSQRGAHIVVDVAGWFTDEFARGGYKGLYVPVDPSRVLDTRRGNGAPEGPLAEGGSIDVVIANEAGVPASGAAGVIVNLTAVRSKGPGYVTLFPTGTERELVASLNIDLADQIVPNLVASPLGTGGRVSIFHQRGGDLVADVAGWFTA